MESVIKIKDFIINFDNETVIDEQKNKKRNRN